MRISSILKKIKLDKSSRDVVIGVLIAGLMGINLLITQIPWKLDLSRGHAYTLSDSSKRIISTLKDPVEIMFFANSDLPSKFLPTKTEVSDLLSEYKYSSTKVSVKTVDPKSDEASRKLAAEYSIPELQFSSVENDQFAVSSGYFGIGIKVKDKKESIPTIDTQTLEYTISSILYKATSPTQKKVALVGGAPDLSMMGQPGSGESMDTLRQVLTSQSPVEQVDLTKLDSSYRPLVMLDTQDSALTEESLTAVKSYLAGGGAAIFMTDGVAVSNDLVGSSASAKLQPLLDEYGISVNRDLVLSAQSEIVNFGANQSQQYVTQYPYWVRTNMFNPEAPYAANISSLTFPWTSSLSLKKKADVRQVELVRSTVQSWKVTDVADVKPNSVKEPANPGSQLLIAHAKNTKSKGEVIVIPSSRFVQDRYLGRSSNLDFVVNLVNDFSSAGALSGIRARAMQSLPMPSLVNAQKDMFKWGNILLLPLLCVGYGFMRLRMRKTSETNL
ncbi:MAG: GldG family protein [bacterium]